MFTVYVIRSINEKYRYIGITNDLNRRLEEHNKGYNRTTKFYAPFNLIHQEEFNDRILARKREKYLKSGVGREFVNLLEAK